MTRPIRIVTKITSKGIVQTREIEETGLVVEVPSPGLVTPADQNPVADPYFFPSHNYNEFTSEAMTGGSTVVGHTVPFPAGTNQIMTLNGFCVGSNSVEEPRADHYTYTAYRDVGGVLRASAGSKSAYQSYDGPANGVVGVFSLTISGDNVLVNFKNFAAQPENVGSVISIVSWKIFNSLTPVPAP